MAFVKRVLDAMFDKYGGGGPGRREVYAVKEMEAMQLAKAPRRESAAQENGNADGQGGGGAAASITLQRAQDVLDQMVESGFFERSRAAYISLGPRGLMELRGWLQETYDEPAQEGDDPEDVERGRRVRFCETCREVVTVGQRCANYECGFRLHEFCVQKFFHGRSEKKCPKCGRQWTGTDFVGEKAARGYTEPSRRSVNGASRSNTGSGRSTTVPDQDEESE